MAHELFDGCVVHEVDVGVVPPIVTAKPTVSWTLDYALADATLVEGVSSVMVLMDAGNSDVFGLYDVATQQLLGTASGASSLGELIIPSSTPLAVGSKYLVKRLSESFRAEYARECTVRYGDPMVTPDGTVVRGMHAVPSIVIGGASCSLYAAIEVTDPSLAGLSGEVTLAGYFGMAVRDPGSGVDPVVSSNGTWLLLPDSYVAASGVAPLVPGVGFMATDMISIPDDPSLIGLVILHQAFYFEGVDYYASEVLGAVVR